jgi:single-stranded-DNA-specific exonuclease
MNSSGLSDLVRTLLKKRGVDDDGIEAFLSPDYELHTHSPFLFSGMDVAVQRVLQAITAEERIAIYADFDCDGIPGAAVLSDLFQKIGYENVEVYLPHRDLEGYGFHKEAIAALGGRGVKLIITVDVGTTAVESVRYAKEKGIDTIVTDHHEIPGELPDAVAVLNPKIAPYPFPHLCGAAVAYKLAQALLQKGKDTGDIRFAHIPAGWEKWLLDLVAIATVADMVPLIGENRVLAHWGLTVLRKSQRPGIIALCTKLRLRKWELTEDDIGFSIAPRINAASRMDNPDLALRLLTTKYIPEAEMLAAQLEKLNASRKGVVAAIVREARKRTQERFAPGEVVVLGNPEWKPSLLGLAANSIMSERGGVVCLWGRDAHGRIKGSCRSDGGISVVELFTAASKAFSEYGGHAASGGFSVITEEVHALPETLAKAALSLKGVEKEREVRGHDALVTLREVDMPLYRDISLLAPFGVGNPKPIFRFSRVKVAQTKRFGKENNHVEVMLACMDTDSTARAFDFFRSPEDFTHTPAKDADATVLATVERDTFRGGLALRLIDILPA